MKKKLAQLVKHEEIKVSVLMVAITDGQNGGKIVKTGEKFLFEGCLTRSRELPSWAEIAKEEKFDLEKFLADYDKKKAAEAKKAVAPKKDEAKKEDAPSTDAPSLPSLA